MNKSEIHLIIKYNKDFARVNWIYLLRWPAGYLNQSGFDEQFLYEHLILFWCNKKLSFPSCITHGSSIK